MCYIKCVSHYASNSLKNMCLIFGVNIVNVKVNNYDYQKLLKIIIIIINEGRKPSGYSHTGLECAFLFTK